MHMRSWSRWFALGLGGSLLATSPTIAVAADYCLNVASSTIVLKAFALPGKGVCKDARGFFLVSSEVWWVNGMACGSSDGTHVTFTQLAHLPDLIETFAYTIDRSTLSGSMRQCVLDTGSGGGCQGGIGVGVAPCNPAKVPVP